MNKYFKEYLPYIIILFIVVLLRIFVLINATIPSESMESTINVGDRVIGLKCSYMSHEPERGDIVVFHPPLETDDLYIKRIIAIPGDTIEIKNGILKINGDVQEEEYLKEEEWGLGTDIPETVVPEDKYLMMGDNRNESSDSRDWGYADRDSILGKVYFRYWPLTQISSVK